jgi:LysM repeat protein
VRTVSYTVRQGDSLYSIARARATTVDTLMHINGLKRAVLKPGQVILVPLASR